MSPVFDKLDICDPAGSTCYTNTVWVHLSADHCNGLGTHPDAIAIQGTLLFAAVPVPTCLKGGKDADGNQVEFQYTYRPTEQVPNQGIAPDSTPFTVLDKTH